MKQIALSKGKFALVDDEDYDYLMQWNWYYHPKGYAVSVTSSRKKDGTYFQKTIRMHTMVMRDECGKEIDHKNLNGLDNQKHNLRFSSRSQNLMNRGIQKNNSSGFKGVSYHKKASKWFAQIMLNKKQKFLGLFDCKIEAAKVYNQAAIKYHGEFARLNEIPE
jgi:hypothetical protein